MFKSTIIAVSIVTMFTGCGGGGTTSIPDNSAAIKEAISNIAAKVPVQNPYTGAFLSVNGTNVGFIAGSSPHDVVAYVASIIMDGSGKGVATLGKGNAMVDYGVAYKAMLSEQGMRVVLFGETTGISSFGLVQKGPDKVFLVTLRTDGLHIVQVG